MSCTQQRFILMTLDPMHIGTGGYRLGRVDLSIVREPGTNLPKIPGTSLSGAARAYAAMQYEKKQCTGQGQDNADNKDGKSHCPDADCPICYTFGSMKKIDAGNAGTVSIADARLLFFPVYSMAGPVWITSPSTLDDFGVTGQQVSVDKAKWSSEITTQKKLNIGWLMVEKEEGDLKLDIPGLNDIKIKDHLVLVSDKLFAQLVNSNLEVRTSVSIDPNTGAAKDKALFTYEALPRATWLWFDLVEDDYRKKENEKQWPVTKKFNGEEGSLNPQWKSPLCVVRAGLQIAEYLGIGGMGTRGFGRIKTWAVKTQEVSP